MSSGFKRFKILALTAVGALVGTLLTSWYGPQLIAWYFDPPVYNGVNCAPATVWAMNKLLVFQLVGIVLGVSGGLALAFVTRSREEKSAG